ncbi:YidH family protein [Variovorax saccharolyticus]|uniref:YidH family protein n=1 Tax=Variovorax saccharolyticus TaxID=3053516 RepID=UPI00257892C9|nr:DUF202 domain-containing protein [Variovorax sp. J22R187]MDM0021392.1 DUF202 domain-containing protein [Variovorax sp. J22R187]
MPAEPTSSAPPPASSSDLARLNTDLAIERTLMAADRSLMAWVRTALSMISFGFTIYKVLEAMQQQAGMPAPTESPRNMGLFLTALGTLAMVMGTIEYWVRLKSLRRDMRLHLMQPSLIMALIMSITGLGIFAGIILRLL